MGRLEVLLVENFKSWRGRQVIGPFRRFTCIIGPNGSGKSNVMDALSFVMGEKTANLRVKNIQELIYGAHIGKPVSSCASVKIVYVEESGEEKTFTRIIRGGCSEFHFDDNPVSRAAYIAQLEKIGVMVKARNCLVFQGTVESISMKKPKERTQFFEEISTSGELIGEYEEKKRKLLKAEEDAQFNFNKKKNVAAERKHAKLEKEEAERYQSLLEELKINKIQLQLFQLYHNERKIHFLNTELERVNRNLSVTKESLSDHENIVKAKKKEHGMLTRKLQQTEKELKSLEALLNQKRPQYIKAKENTSHHLKKLDVAKKSIKDSKKQCSKQEDDIKALETELVDLDGAWRSFEKQVEEEILYKRRDIELEASQLDRYKELKEQVRKKVAIMTQQLEKLQWEQRADKERLAFEKRRHGEVQIKPINERLREIKGCKMMIDVIKTQFPQLKKVIQFVCGNGLVCETVEEARHIAFGGPERRKTVALDGTLFLKSGVISGGSSDLKYKARCWDEKEIKNLRDRRTQLIQELKDLMKILRKEADLKQIQTLVQGTHTRLKYSQSELEMIKKKQLAAFYREQSQLQSELLNIESQCTMLSEGVKERQQRIEEFQEEIDKVEDDIFQHFCEEIGVENIREFEKKHVKQQQEIDQKRLEFEKQKTRLNVQLEYSRNQLKKKLNKIRTLEETIGKGGEDIDSLKKAEETCLQIVDELMAKRQQLKDVFVTQNANTEKVQAQLEEERKKVLAVDREVGRWQKEVVVIQTSLEQKRLEKHNMLLDCKVQDLEIILSLGSLDDIVEVELGTEAESTQATSDIYEKEAAIEVDYSSLREDLKALQTDKEVEASLRLLLQQVASQEEVLLKTAAPNLRALENLKTVRDKFQESTDAFEASRKEARMCRQEFEQVKKRRYDLFSQCFEHVSVSIDQIYKKLCRNVSAQAFLSPENPEEPYLEGISYNCVAPGKRFMPMDNLSGGEKCVAALALLFAVHSFRPAPFFVLDEVDAALDNTNIGKVSSYIKEQTQEQFQMIIISLKEEFYSQADALIGIYPEFDDCMFSRVLTLDLSQYPDTEGQESSKRNQESR
ncbi:structural maintenance of chromosomes protein 1B isoform X4 [Prionailurus bengalensis]|uniref:structural maintenance of chromosomes protein 1B isoform X4 n=1 Tax=Prionailurus bengalensis TaxID=37029 RepID=UPI001CA87630|nr:structural maintenance of chromosomes protein 1B isoform X4 [Prionailurus bengalensis]